MAYFNDIWRASRGRYPGGRPGPVGPATADGTVIRADGSLGRWSTEPERYDVLEAYRGADDLYGRMRSELQVRGYEGLRNLRNPANRQIEFYATKLSDRFVDHIVPPKESESRASVDAEEPEGGSPGPIDRPSRDETAPPEAPQGAREAEPALPFEDLLALIVRVYEDSNWLERIEEAGRNLATNGDLFVRVQVGSGGRRVELALLDPRWVADDFETDARGYFTYLRLDVPHAERAEDEPDGVREYWVTEVFDKGKGQYTMYEHEEGPEADLADLGDFVVTSALLSESPPEGFPVGTLATGYDFVPVVHFKLKGTGGRRGEGAFQHALAGIDAANWLVTRLFKMMFPRTVWKLTRGPGPGGLGLPAANLEAEAEADRRISLLTQAEQEGFAMVEVDGDRTVRLPGNTDLSPMVPPHDFGGHLAALESHQRELEKDMPELAYYRLREMSDISGRAAERLLGDVIDRLGRARRRFEEGHVRLHKMALTIGALARVPGFEAVPPGAYGLGLLDHGFEEYDLFPAGALERAEGSETEARALTAWRALGPIVYAKKLEEAGFSPEEARQIADSDDTRAAALRASVPTLAGRIPDTAGADPDLQAAVESLLGNTES